MVFAQAVAGPVTCMATTTAPMQAQAGLLAFDADGDQQQSDGGEGAVPHSAIDSNPRTTRAASSTRTGIAVPLFTKFHKLATNYEPKGQIVKSSRSRITALTVMAVGALVLGTATSASADHGHIGRTESVCADGGP